MGTGTLPNGIYLDENEVPVYTQCTGDDCGRA